MNYCIFCGPTSSPITREHLWPKWISRLILRAKKDSGFEHKGYQTVLSGKANRSWNMRGFDDTIRCVCKQCNSGWMGKLEDRAKPILTKLIPFSLPHTLSMDAQGVIATWCMLRALILEQYHPSQKGRFYTHEEHRLFASSLQLPSVLISGAQYIGTRPASSNRWSLLLWPKKVEPIPLLAHHLQLSTFCIGQFAFQVVGIRRPKDSAERPIISSLWKSVTVQFWPVIANDIRWPQPFLLNDDGLDEFRRRFTPTRGAGLARSKNIQ